MPTAPAPGPWAQDVLELVEQVPPGQVVTYGDLARMLGRGGARHVGQVMSRYGGGAPWWRVVRADGTLPPGLQAQAARQWGREGTATLDLPAGGVRVDLRRARWSGWGARVPRG